MSSAIQSEPVAAWLFKLTCQKCGHVWSVVAQARPDRCGKCKARRFWEPRS